MVSLLYDQSALPLILSLLVVGQAYEHFVCKDECYNIQVSRVNCIFTCDNVDV